MMEGPEDILRAAAAVREADLLLVATGAGCSRDSGLPTFQESPGYAELCNAQLLSGPDASADAHQRFYGFWAAAMERYAATAPHAGYALLAKWARAKDAMAVTSNVDGALQKCGFPGTVVPIHGETKRDDWQCAVNCSGRAFALPEDFSFERDGARAFAFPHCPDCGALARPRVLMFQDTHFMGIPEATDAAYPAFCVRVKQALRANPQARLCILEIGCGDRVPTIRTFTEGQDLLASFFNNGTLWADPRDESSARVTLVRINPDPALAGIVRVSAKHLHPYVVSVVRTAKLALEMMDEAM